MKIKTSNAIASTLVCILAATFVTGCENKNAGGVASPSIEETKAIAEEGFIYGLPIVMNYAVMYEYVVNKSGPQFKAPFNEFKNEARVFTYEDTAIVTPNSDTLYSFLWLDLRAEPMVLSVPAVDKKRYYAQVMLAMAMPTTMATLAAVRQAMSRATISWSALIRKGETPAGIKKVFLLVHALHACRLSDPAL